MENLFVYGTLKNKEVLKLVIDREPQSSKDGITGYRLEEITIDGETYPIFVPDKKQKKLIDGLVISITEEEMKKLDEYETDVYERKNITLKSGKKAFVYFAKTL